MAVMNQSGLPAAKVHDCIHLTYVLADDYDMLDGYLAALRPLSHRNGTRSPCLRTWF